MNIRLTHSEFLHFRYFLPVVEADVASWISQTGTEELTTWRDAQMWS